MLPDKELYKVSEVADHYGVGSQTIRRWIKEGRIESVNLAPKGRQPSYRIPRRAVVRAGDFKKGVHRPKPKYEVKKRFF